MKKWDVSRSIFNSKFMIIINKNKFSINNYFLFLITLLTVSCGAHSNAGYTLQDHDPFNQNLAGKIKSITRRHYSIFDGCHPDSIAIQRDEKNYLAHFTTYDSSGRMLTLTDTFPELNHSVIHRIMTYTNNVLSGWLGNDIRGRQKYKGYIHSSGDSVYTSFLVKPEGDTGIIEHYLAGNGDIAADITYKTGDTIIYTEKKIYAYTPGGTMKSCRHITGREEGTTSYFEIVEKDDHGNPIRIHELWNNNEYKCRVIEYAYQYYE